MFKALHIKPVTGLEQIVFCTFSAAVQSVSSLDIKFFRCARIKVLYRLSILTVLLHTVSLIKIYIDISYKLDIPPSPTRNKQKNLVLYSSCLLVRHIWCCIHTEVLGCFHTSTFGAHPGSFDVRVRFVWMMWTLSSDLRCAPANRTRVRIKRVVWGTVQVNSGTVRCWCERNRTKSQKWPTINVVLFDKNVFHSLSWRAWLTRCKQRAVCIISVRLQRSLEHLQHIRKTDVSAVMHWSFVNKTNGSKT